MTPSKRAPRGPLMGFLRVLLLQPLWAVPFAMFFGTIYGARWESYVQSYQFSLVFALTIGFALWATRYFIEPRLRVDPESDSGGWVMASAYVGMAMLGSYVAVVVLNFTLAPGYLGNLRSLLLTTMFSLVFVGLFSAASMARIFYRKAVARARAIEQTRAELAQAELRALRAQIHPHFLFNTLNSIASLIAVNPAAAEETTTQLADAFRYTLRASERELAKLGDELQFLRSVLAIERTRFGDRLRVVEAIEPGLEDILVPSLLLQPVVENAVRHGVASRVEGGTVRLSARRDGDLLRLSVADDGPGLDPHATPRGEGFGLHSVRERVRLAGPPHALEIITPPGGGTEIRITHPIPVIPGANERPAQGDSR